MRSGEGLENLTADIFEVLTSNQAHSGQVTVESDVTLEGADGPRQIDVVLRSSVGPIKLVTIIECKDYVRKVDVTKVDALHSVLQDVRASKAILVSRGGFSRTAIRKANRLGIGLYRANQLGNVREAAFEVPIYLREIRPTAIDAVCRFRATVNTSINRYSLTNANDLDIAAVVRDQVIEEASLHNAPAGRHALRIPPPWFIRDVEGRPIELDELTITFELEERHYFGYLSDVKAARYLHDELENRSTVLISAEDFAVDYVEMFSRFDSPSDLPALPRITVQVAVAPDEPDWSQGKFRFEDIT